MRTRYLLFIAFLFSIFSLSAQKDFNIKPLTDGVYVHSRMILLNSDDSISINGLLLDIGDGLLLFNLPPLEEDNLHLKSWIDQVLNKPVVMIVLTHLNQAQSKGVEFWIEQGSSISSHMHISDELSNFLGSSIAGSFPDGYYSIGNCDFELVQLSDNRIDVIFTGSDIIYSGFGTTMEENENSRLSNEDYHYDSVDNMEHKFIIPVFGEYLEFENVDRN